MKPGAKCLLSIYPHTFSKIAHFLVVRDHQEYCTKNSKESVIVFPQTVV